MIINLRPLNNGMLDCIVEDVDERLSAEQQEELLTTVRDVLGNDEEEDEAGILKTMGTTTDANGANGLNGHTELDHSREASS